MKEQDRIIKHISLIKFKDPRIIKSIVYHPLLFTRKKMADPDDTRPIRIRYFGVFVGKYMRNKENFKKLSYMKRAIKQHPNVINVFADPVFKDFKELRKYIQDLFDNNDVEVFEEFYKIIYKAIGDI